MRGKYVKMSMEPKYVARRTIAALVIIGMVAGISFWTALASDRLAESVCVDQLDKKSEWAVAYAKEQGWYPYVR